jgi:FKBP-type peptidyl-prolyl cis-trans isomerase
MNHVHPSRYLVVLFALVLLVLGTPHPGLALQQTQAQPAAVPAPPDVAAPPADAQKTPSGLYTKVIAPGTGTVRPHATDKVTVNYTGWTADGRMFDSTTARSKPSTFQLNRVLPGWTEGVQLMVVGETRRLWVPAKLAFNGAAGRPQGTVVFDIELLSIEEAPPAPPDVAAPPADSQKSGSGLASKVLKPGTGAVHPTKDSTVTVHYTGWTTDGQMFDSSVMAGKPATFSLGQVIRGWTEGVPLMVEGEKRRFWIPEKLAYAGQSGKPRGMLVFDVELLSIGQ